MIADLFGSAPHAPMSGLNARRVCQLPPRRLNKAKIRKAWEATVAYIIPPLPLGPDRAERELEWRRRIAARMLEETGIDFAAMLEGKL